MTAAQILAAAFVHICTPGPTGKWDHDIQVLLDRHTDWLLAEQTAEFGSDDWRSAFRKRHGIEMAIGTALGIHDYRPGSWPIPA